METKRQATVSDHISTRKLSETYPQTSVPQVGQPAIERRPSSRKGRVSQGSSWTRTCFLAMVRGTNVVTEANSFATEPARNGGQGGEHFR